MNFQMCLFVISHRDRIAHLNFRSDLSINLQEIAGTQEVSIYIDLTINETLRSNVDAAKEKPR